MDWSNLEEKDSESASRNSAGHCLATASAVHKHLADRSSIINFGSTLDLALCILDFENPEL